MAAALGGSELGFLSAWGCAVGGRVVCVCVSLLFAS